MKDNFLKVLTEREVEFDPVPAVLNQFLTDFEEPKRKSAFKSWKNGSYNRIIRMMVF